MREDNHIEAVSLVRNGGRKELVEAFREAVAAREPFWK
jgi:hypothetical protein